MTKSLKVVLIVIAIIAIMGFFFPRGNSVVNQMIGAVPTLDGVDSSFVKINGVQTAYVSQPINATSTMLCNIKNPYTSTSTITGFSVRVTSGILGANAFSISTSSTYYGSSTPVLVLDHNIPSNSIDSMQWLPGATTTASANRILPGNNLSTGETNYIVKNGEFVVVRVATTTGAGALAAYYGGQCSATFTRQ